MWTIGPERKWPFVIFNPLPRPVFCKYYLIPDEHNQIKGWGLPLSIEKNGRIYSKLWCRSFLGSNPGSAISSCVVWRKLLHWAHMSSSVRWETMLTKTYFRGMLRGSNEVTNVKHWEQWPELYVSVLSMNIGMSGLIELLKFVPLFLQLEEKAKEPNHGLWKYLVKVLSSHLPTPKPWPWNAAKLNYQEHNPNTFSVISTWL